MVIKNKNIFIWCNYCSSLYLDIRHKVLHKLVVLNLKHIRSLLDIWNNFYTNANDHFRPSSDIRPYKSPPLAFMVIFMFNYLISMVLSKKLIFEVIFLC